MRVVWNVVQNISSPRYLISGTTLVICPATAWRFVESEDKHWGQRTWANHGLTYTFVLLFYDMSMYTKTLGQGEIASQTSWTDTACCLSEKGRLTQSSVNFIHLFQLFGDPDMMKTEGWWSNKENPQRTAFAGVTNDWPVNKKKKKVSRHLFHQGLSLEILNLSVVILYNGLSH